MGENIDEAKGRAKEAAGDLTDGAVHAALVLQALVVGEIAGRFLGAALRLIDVLTH